MLHTAILYGTDLFERLCEVASKIGVRVFLLGGVLEQLIALFRASRLGILVLTTPLTCLSCQAHTRLVDYACFQGEQLYSIGSGTVESRVKQLDLVSSEGVAQQDQIQAQGQVQDLAQAKEQVKELVQDLAQAKELDQVQG